MSIQELIDTLTKIKNDYDIEGSHVRIWIEDQMSDDPVLLYDYLSGYLNITKNNQKITKEEIAKIRKEREEDNIIKENLKKAQQEYNELTAKYIEENINKMRKYIK